MSNHSFGTNVSSRSLPVFLLVASLLLFAAPATAAPAGAASDSVDARVLAESTTMKIHDDGTAEFSFRRRVQIWNENGQKYGTMIFEDSRFVKTTEANAQVYNSSGNLIQKKSKKDAVKVCGYGEYALYTDDCEYVLQLGAGNFPFIVDYEYQQKISTLFSWPFWHPQRTIPVDTSSYVLTVPAAFAFRTKVFGNVADPQVEQVGDNKIFTWKAVDLPAYESESYMPPAQLFLPGLIFNADNFKFGKFQISGADWSSISRSIDDINQDAYEMSKEQQQTLDEMFPGKSADQAGLDRLHRFLSSRSRYVAVKVGLGGWQAHPSQLTYSHSYGDCKDLSAMYASMFRYIGAPTRLALAMTRDDGRVDPRFPMMNFNHVFVFYLNGADTVWADPTCFTCALGDLPWTDENIFVLAVSSDGGALLRTPASTPEENVIERTATLTLGADLGLSIVGKIHARGNPGAGLKQLSKEATTGSQTEILKYFPQIVSDNLQITECKADPAVDRLSEVVLNFKGTTARYQRRVNGKLYLDLSALPIMSGPEEVDLVDRKFPVNCRYPLGLVDSITVVAPAGYYFSDVPVDTSVTDDFGIFRYASNISSDTLVVTRYKTFNLYEIDTASIQPFIEHRYKLRTLSRRSLVLDKR